MKRISPLLILCAILPLSLVSQDSQEMDQAQNDQQESTVAQKKSGFVLGIEALFGSSMTHEENQSSSNFSLMGGFYGGYQHYFDDYLGVRALVSIHDGTPIMGEFHHNQSIKTSALPFWVGTELDLLWDFWQAEEHVLGLGIGLGYNFEIYYAREVKIGETSHNLPAIFQHNLYPILGFHYYYGHHQMSLNYRFIGSLNSKIKEYSIEGIPFKTKYSFTDYLNFSYTYRF